MKLAGWIRIQNASKLLWLEGSKPKLLPVLVVLKGAGDKTAFSGLLQRTEEGKRLGNTLVRFAVNGAFECIFVTTIERKANLAFSIIGELILAYTNQSLIVTPDYNVAELIPIKFV